MAAKPDQAAPTTNGKKNPVVTGKLRKPKKKKDAVSGVPAYGFTAMIFSLHSKLGGSRVDVGLVHVLQRKQTHAA